MNALAELVELLAVQSLDGDHTAPSQLRQLRHAIWGNVGRTKPGAGDPARMPIDAAAFTLWENLDGQIAAQFEQVTDRMRAGRDPEANLLAWYAAFSAAAVRGLVSPLMLSVATERLAAWSWQISEYFDGPVVKELVFECPMCGERFAVLGTGDAAVRVAALSVTYRPGSEIEAACSNCHTRWIGKVEVIHLGRQAGQVIDVDAIREALVPTPQ